MFSCVIASEAKQSHIAYDCFVGTKRLRRAISIRVIIAHAASIRRGDVPMKMLLSLGAVLFLLTACAEIPPAVDLDAANNGVSLETTSGVTINLTLDSNATTGYSWSFATEPSAAILKTVSSGYVSPGSTGTPVAGAGGKQVWKFLTNGRGTTTLKLVYVRPFDPTQIAREFTATIVVK
jgi:predicted secreted protein